MSATRLQKPKNESDLQREVSACLAPRAQRQPSIQILQLSVWFEFVFTVQPRGRRPTRPSSRAREVPSVPLRAPKPRSPMLPQLSQRSWEGREEERERVQEPELGAEQPLRNRNYPSRPSLSPSPPLSFSPSRPRSLAPSESRSLPCSLPLPPRGTGGRRRGRGGSESATQSGRSVREREVEEGERE